MKKTKLSLFALLLSLLFLGNCSKSSDISVNASGGSGIAGSLARFTIIDNYLYTLDVNRLSWFRLAPDGRPEELGSLLVGEGMETIFPLNEYLFLGAETGMSIYRIGADGAPVETGLFSHTRSCDPVVANDSHAYVTLRVSECSRAEPGAADRLDVLSLAEITSPQLIESVSLQSPRGLGLDGNRLFVCDGANGVRVFDVSDPRELQQIHQLTGFTAYDVILINGLMLIIGPENIYQYDYSVPGEYTLISTLTLGV